MTQRLEAQGCKGGTLWDDGTEHDDVTKIYVRCYPQGVQSIRFDYEKSGELKYGSINGFSNQGFTQTFEINHRKNEHLESVEGYYVTDSIVGLQFRTNFKISELMGYDSGTKFTLAVNGKRIIGFHGSAAGKALYSLGAYFTWISPTKSEAKGGKGGKEWDDGSDHEGVTTIYVRGGLEGIHYIKFDYVKDGKPKDGPVHGFPGRGFTQTFEIRNLDQEYLISIEGYYDNECGVIQALQFKTNMKTSELMGYDKGNKFTLAEHGKKIIGVHGYAEKNLNSIGAYFTTLISLTKLDSHGGTDGVNWDDGAFKGIRKVSALYTDSAIRDIRLEYDNDGEVEKRHHHSTIGLVGLGEEFVVDYPNEFITSVKMILNVVSPSNTWVTSLTFKTSKGRTSATFGKAPDQGSKEVVLERKGCALVGFHGRTYIPNSALMALGAYFYPLPPPSAADKIEAQGGSGGSSWDDGGFDDVRKIYIGLAKNSIAFVKFLYDKNTEVVVGDDHGNKTLFGVEEFELEYPSEYITSVEGSYDAVSESGKSEAILMLKFTTNKRSSPCFGLDDESSFMLHKDSHKIVGFHGKSSNLLHKIGVHVLPI